jgi:hypothetical protein
MKTTGADKDAAARPSGEKWRHILGNRMRPRLFSDLNRALLTKLILGSRDALSETLVSQFEALAKEEAVAHQKGLPIPSRFKPRESVWPTPQRERGSVNTQPSF